MKKAVIGIVRSKSEAESIIKKLLAEGFSNNDISVLLPNTSTTRDFAHTKSTKAPEGAIAGVGAGGLIGGTIGLLAGVGTLAIPGLGPFIAAGPILMALSGVAAGASLGGITGALVGMGIPEIEAKRYEGKIRSGNVLISVHTESGDEMKHAKRIFEDAGADDVGAISEASVPRASRSRSLI